MSVSHTRFLSTAIPDLSICGQVSASLGEEGSERALQEFNTARASLKWIKNFFTNQMQTFLAADLQGLKKWSPQQEIPQPGYAPGAIRMAPTVAVGVDGIIATLNVRMLCICIVGTKIATCICFIVETLQSGN